MTADAANAAARERLGDLGTVKSERIQILEEELRLEARRDWFDDLRQDVRFGIRSALRSPVFSVFWPVRRALPSCRGPWGGCCTAYARSTPWALGSGAGILILSAVIALMVPVRRATRADPISVLR